MPFNGEVGYPLSPSERNRFKEGQFEMRWVPLIMTRAVGGGAERPRPSPGTGERTGPDWVKNDIGECSEGQSGTNLPAPL